MSVHVRYFRKDKFIKMFDESDQSDLLSNVAGGSFEFPNDHVRLQHEVQCPCCDVVHPLSGVCACVRWYLVAVLWGGERDGIA